MDDFLNVRSLSASVVALAGLSACMPTDELEGLSKVAQFNIQAKTVDCVGVAPMRCLVVNNELFYDSIEGYIHVEGQPAQIFVERRMRPKPVPADAGLYLYRKVSG